MQPLKAQVRNGRLLLDEPTDLPEGSLVFLQPVDGLAAVGDDGPGDDERAHLHRDLEASIAEADRGYTEEFSKVLREQHAFANDADASAADELDDEERAELERELEASFDEEEAGQLIDAADAIADLRSIR